MIVGVSPWSHGSSNTNSESISVLIGQNKSSVRVGSDSLSSGIEYEPLLVVVWHGVSDSKSVLVVTNVLMSEEGSVSTHSGLDLESSSVSEWVLLWKSDTFGVNVPSLSLMVLVPPPGHGVVVAVSPSVRSQDKVAPVLNVLSSVVEGSLVDTVSPWSSDGISTLDESSGSDLP